MIILDTPVDEENTGDSLQLSLGVAPTNPLYFTTSAVEFDDPNESVTLLNNSGIILGTDALTILDSPSDSGRTRQLKSLTVYNADIASSIITLILNDNGILVTILTITINIGDTLQYNDGEGFRVIDSNGNIKIISLAAPVVIETFVENQTNPGAATLTDAYVVPTGKFEFQVTVVNRSAVATAFRWSIAIAGAADNDIQYKAYDTAIAGNDIYVSETYKVNGTDVIRVYATLATLSFGINGILRA